MHRSVALLAFTVPVVAAVLMFGTEDASCPAGTEISYVIDGKRVCQQRLPESPRQILQAHDALYARAGVVPAGAYRAAVAQKQQMEPLKASVPRASGSWAPYGRGNLQISGGYNNASGRVDNFAYDPVGKRLFAALGSGGVWMSEAVGGDVRTLGNSWRAIDAALPSIVISGIGWTPAGGGTVIAVGGESVMGSSGYLGLGAFWSTDLGATWNQASGVPDAALAFRVAVDPGKPDIVYAATSKGLFRSADAGRSYVNVRLPTTEDCAGVETLGPCQFTNYVTDVVVRAPGGSTGETCSANGCPVLAGVGFRTGAGLAFQDGRPMAPANGLYRSDTGEVNTFARLDVSAVSAEPFGFTPQSRIGRIELATATGDDQDHRYVYAIVQDAELFNDGLAYIDAPVDLPALPLPIAPVSTVFHGIFVSADFGDTWVRMADTAEVAANPASESDLIPLQAALGYQPGVQAWYNAWVAVDPTATASGVSTRLSFGLEEVWQSTSSGVAMDGLGQQGPSDFAVFGSYYGTTHADQHAGLYIPTGDGGVCLFAGNDGGAFRQCVASGEAMTAAGWETVNTGIYALLPYGLGVARDGTVWWGLQDNGSGKTTRTGRSTEYYGGDGIYAEVDPDNSNIAFVESQNANMVVTTDGGASFTAIAPTMTAAAFDNFFVMDPLSAKHLLTGGQEIFETTLGSDVRSGTWVEVFNLGTNPDTGAIRRQTTIGVRGDAVYVGYCGDCGVSGNDTGFRNGIATNVGGAAPPKPESPDGWHIAAAAGLDNRYITSIAIDPADARTIYVSLGGYTSNLRPPGSYLDPNTNIGNGVVFKSTDAGESFTDISGNLPGVQANSVILHDGQLLLGTDIGVFISGDTGGGTWAPLGDGLPNVPVTMLRMKPGSDQLFASTFGRHLWTYPMSGGSVASEAPASSGTLLGAAGPGLLALLALGAALRRRRR